jgi:hypothetical protein
VWAGAIGIAALAPRTFSAAARPTIGLFYICLRLRVRFERCVTSLGAMNFPALDVRHSRAQHCE